jgi:hypothetical protein
MENDRNIPIIESERGFLKRAWIRFLVRRQTRILAKKSTRAWDKYRNWKSTGWTRGALRKKIDNTVNDYINYIGEVSPLVDDEFYVYCDPIKILYGKDDPRGGGGEFIVKKIFVRNKKTYLEGANRNYSSIIGELPLDGLTDSGLMNLINFLCGEEFPQYLREYRWSVKYEYARKRISWRKYRSYH